MKNLKLVFYSLLLALLLVSCGANKPDKVAVKFLEASAQKNYAEAKKYCDNSSAELLDMVSSFSEISGEKPEESLISILSSDIKDDMATITYKTDKSEEEKKLTLKKIEGEWKVALGKEN